MTPAASPRCCDRVSSAGARANIWARLLGSPSLPSLSKTALKIRDCSEDLSAETSSCESIESDQYSLEVMFDSSQNDSEESIYRSLDDDRVDFKTEESVAVGSETEGTEEEAEVKLLQSDAGANSCVERKVKLTDEDLEKITIRPKSTFRKR